MNRGSARLVSDGQLATRDPAPVSQGRVHQPGLYALLRVLAGLSNARLGRRVLAQMAHPWWPRPTTRPDCPSSGLSASS